eukprot:366111-Chlamydomonas_euryale.AAC.21
MLHPRQLTGCCGRESWGLTAGSMAAGPRRLEGRPTAPTAALVATAARRRGGALGCSRAPLQT